MENQVSMKRDLGPKEKGVEYIEFIDDLKKGIIAVSAILNSRRSATLYFGVNDSGRVVFAVPTKYFSHKTFYGWDYFDFDACPKKFFIHGLIYHLRDYLVEEIERALSPKVSVRCIIENLGDWSNVWDEKISATPEEWLENRLGRRMGDFMKCVKSLGNFGVIKFCIKGGEAPYAAYGQYYMCKNGGIYPLKSDKYTVPEIPKQVVSIGPKTEQSIYIETFSDLREGLESASIMLQKYPYVTLYFGVKDDGTIIDPRSAEETESDLTEARKRTVESLLRKFTLDPRTIFGVEKIGEANVARVIILPKKYEKYLKAYDDYYANQFYKDVYQHIFGWEDIEKRDSYFIWPTFDSQRHRVNIFEAPVREVTFQRIKELLIDKKYTWDNFEAEFGSALFDKNGRYSLLASLIGDNIDSFLGLHFINLGHVKVEMPRWKNSNHCLFDWLGDLFNNLYKANDVWTGMIDGEEVKFQQFDVAELRNAFLCALVHNDWTTLHIPIIEITDTSIALVFRATNVSGWDAKEFIPKENEPLVKLMKIIFELNDEDISFSRIRKKYGMWFVHNTGDGYSHMEFPIRVRI